jgi:MFS family permease
MGLFVGTLNTSTELGIASISLAFAFGQLWWGLTQPLAGIVADRVGPGRVLFAGVLLVALGTALVPFMHTTGGLILAIGVLAAGGAGMAGPSVLMAATTRLVAPAHRGMATGIVNAGGSFGQFAFAPIAQKVTELAGWAASLQTLAAVSLLALRNRVFLRLGVRNVRRRPGRSALIVVGLMLGTAVIAAALATGDTMTRTVRSSAVSALGQTDELVAAKGATQIGLEREAPRRRLVHLLGEELVVRAAELLRVVHRRVRVADQRLGVAAVIGKNGDADRAAHGEVAVVESEGLRDLLDHLLRDLRGIG